ncbi:MAG: pyridoxal-dependent decarboxylase, exosortase A system-associated [Actinobacteria bacterium]|nr:pyridoxal-dependent decarboxylase, exosortase A system-associated [Actinomycetota bacterium]
MNHKALKSALSHFEQKDGQLLVNGHLVAEIAEEYSTPLYIYDSSFLSGRHKMLRKMLPQDLEITYAVKANPNAQVLRILGKLYDGVDIASRGEMVKALKVGIPAQQMSFTGPGKSSAELEYAIKLGIGSISVENEREIEHIRTICEQNDLSANILIRVNPDFELARSGMKMGGGPKQFGIDSEKVPALVSSLKNAKRTRLRGIHIFSGSQNLVADAIVETFEKIIDYACSLSATTQIPLDIVNLGGGFGIPYYFNDSDLDLSAVGAGLRQVLANAKKNLPGTRFKIELGRYIVGESGMYVGKILYRKESRGEIFIIIDGGLHHHLAASGNFGQKMVHRPMPITIANALDNPIEKVNVVGALCTPLDTFGTNVELPRAKEGDLVVVLNSGAYGFSASPLGFLSHNPPKEVVL